MQGFEKILEEINAEFDRHIGTRLKIIAGTNDDVYRYGYGKSLEAYQQGKLFVEDIIRKHMNDSWIPVEERLPEDGEKVLGTNEYGEIFVYRYGLNRTRTRKMFFHVYGAAANVTAWRPLPEPYSPERSEVE